MADLYGTSSSPATEPEEISDFLHQLLHNPSSASKFMHHAFSSSSTSPPPPPAEASSAAGLLDRHLFRRSETDCRAGGGNSDVNFSDPGGYCGKETAENGGCSVSSKRRGVSVENDAGDLSCDSEGTERSELPSDSVRPRSSSKRSRTAEVHNLSEKRRRSRINEKMKALQNLIPNSNKTDKASMLDEAIEYLKQLQLQVQMLTMRNGLSLHPMCLPGVLQPVQLPLSGLGFEQGNILLNTNTTAGAFSANEESSIHTSHNLPNQGTVSNQPIVFPSRASINSSETTFGFDPMVQVHHGPFSVTTSTKEIHGEGNPALLDVNQTLKTSTSSMS
ncbi:hypothetical protein K2173_026172 [Erythroxylum novogranatense]|uniref:BHLH domain-containing protein n=1 Tax=Erythroxylum novogranatense TaxID=1862640 RepID=A0AAV8T8Y8_9ROSI|nr:hypothetical protein K2173_026172 [Erythroxylum novogranatense]